MPATKPSGPAAAPPPFVFDPTAFSIADTIPQDVLDGSKRVTGDKLPLKALFTALAPAVAPGKNPTKFIPVVIWEGKAKDLSKENLQPKIRSQFNDWVKLDEEKRKNIALAITYRPNGDPEAKTDEERKALGAGFTVWLMVKAA